MTPALLPYILLFAAATAALARARPVVVWGCASGSVGFALALGVVEPEGLWAIALGVALALAPALRPANKVLLACVVVGAGLYVLAASLRLLPGFPSMVLVEAFGRSGDGVVAWRYDKGFAGLILLWLHQRYLSVPAPAAVKPRLVVLFIGTVGLLGLAMATGLAEFAPALPAGWWLWILGNAYLTVVAEEALFRGLIQRGLDRLLADYAVVGHAAAVGITAALFGLVHLPWGPAFALLAVLAGVFYGLVYGRAHSLSWAVAAHAGGNALLLLLMHSPFG